MRPAVLVIRGAQSILHQGQQTMSMGFIHLAVIKIVINGTGHVWAGFDLELQETPNQPSPYGDGLSFDQLGKALPHETLIRGNPSAPLSNNGCYVFVPGSLGHEAANALVRTVAGVRYR